MKKILTFVGAAALVCSGSVLAKTLNLKQGNVTYLFQLGESSRYTVDKTSTPATLNVENFEFPLDNTSILVTDKSVENNVVEVVFNGVSAEVFIASNIADYVSATCEGANVSIVQSADVDASNCGEITYRLKGNSDNGSFNMTGSFKATVELDGLTLTNPAGAALDIQNGKRIKVKANNGTVNNLTDGADGSQKGAIVCKGHLEFKGKGELNVSGNKSHAIYAKEYVEISDLTLTVKNSVKDAINCTQYFKISSGNVVLNNVGDDGVQVDYKDATDREAEDTGSITVAGGKITATITATAAKAMKSEGNIFVTGGELDLKVTGNGLWDDAKQKTKASACLSSDENVTISGGQLKLEANGSGGKGINCDEALTIEDGDLNVTTSGGILVYSNGSLNHNYTGNTDRIDSDMKSSPKGMKAKGDVVIKGGTINIVCTGNGGEGIESKNELLISGGELKVLTVDDAINSASTMTIEGGNVLVVSSGNDGLDSNGDMWLKGGTIRAFGSRAPECGIDVNSEEGYKLYITGGNILAVGGGNSTPSNSQSTQPYITPSLSVSKNQTLTVSQNGTQIATFEIPAEYTGTSSSGPGWGGPGGGPGGMGGGMLVSVPSMKTGESYSVSNGTSTATATSVQYGGGGNFPR